MGHRKIWTPDWQVNVARIATRLPACTGNRPQAQCSNARGNRLKQRRVASSTASSVHPRIVFSGIQPTGTPHLGNYVGALRQWVKMQELEATDTKLMYSIVDLHALTTTQNPEQLRRYKRESLAALLAIGVDPRRSTIFFQSSVSADFGTRKTWPAEI